MSDSPAKSAKSYDITYRKIDDYHVITSKKIPGLYIASKDPAKALADVPTVVADLERLDGK